MGDLVSFYEQQMKKDTYSPINDILLLDRIIRSSCPEANGTFFFADETDDVNRFMQKLADSLKDFERKPWFDAGHSNNPIEKLKLLGNGNWLMNTIELKIHGIWLYSWDNAYADVILIELEDPKPYIINGEEHSAVAYINGKEIVELDKIDAGYIRISGTPVAVSDLDIETRLQWCKNPLDKNMYMFIGSTSLSTMQLESVSIRWKLGNKHLGKEELEDLWKRFWRKMPNELLDKWF